MKNEECKRLLELIQVFLEENKKLNLSAYRTEETCWIGNILDSLSFLDILPSLKIVNCKLKILDIGTGGGFPLLPLAICLHDIQCTGIDSTKKKIDAVERIVHAMQLSNVNVIWGRAEEHKTQYDIVLARAIAPLKKLLPIASSLTKPDGYLVFWKSMKIEEELKESVHMQHKLGCTLIDKHVYELPGNLGERQLLIFKKR